MPIVKVDGRRFIDSGTIIVSGDAVVEILATPDFLDKPHEVALKFRSGEGKAAVRFGNPKPNRTVVHFLDFPMDSVSAGDGIHIGGIGQYELWLAFVIQPYKDAPGNVRHLTYTLYGRMPNK